MIRRLFILVGSIIGIVFVICLFSEIWQFGYVSPSHSVGLRGGTLWRITRSTPMSDPDGFYVAGAADVNLAMRTITSQVNWSYRPVWQEVLLPTIAFSYALLVLGSRRLLKQPLPRVLRMTLCATATMTGLAWGYSQFGVVTLDVAMLHFRLEEGNLNAFWDRDGTAATYYGGSGVNWSWGTRSSTGILTFVPQYWPPAITGKKSMAANVPVGVLTLLLAVPAILFVRWDPRQWAHHCTRCRYDLTGNVSGICPECGVPLLKSEPTRVTGNL